MSTTPNFSHPTRDVQGAFLSLVKDSPTLLSRIRVGPAATATKIEWFDNQLTPVRTATTTTGTSATTLTVTSSAGLEAGAVLRLESATGQTRDELMIVTAVNSATEIVVVRAYAGTTAFNVVSGDVLVLHSVPRNENTQAVLGGINQGTLRHNFVQIFDKAVTLSRTATQVGQFGGANTKEYQMFVKMTEIQRDILNALIYGRPVERTNSVPGMTAGFQHYMTGGNVTNVAGAISSAAINAAVEAIATDGAIMTQPILLVSPNQARKISAFNTTGSNPQLIRDAASTITGTYVSQFIGDIPIGQNAQMVPIYCDFNCPKDRAFIIDLDRVSIRYLQGMTEMDATLPGQDGQAWRILTELAFEVIDGQYAHAALTGLTI